MLSSELTVHTVKPYTTYHQQMLTEKLLLAVSAQHENDCIYTQSSTSTLYTTFVLGNTLQKFGVDTVSTYLGDQRGSLRRSKPLMMKLYRSSNPRWTTLLLHRYTHRDMESVLC